MAINKGQKRGFFVVIQLIDESETKTHKRFSLKKKCIGLLAFTNVLYKSVCTLGL